MQTTSRKFTLEIRIGNDAMTTPDDLAQALRQVADHINNKQYLTDKSLSKGIVDANGNTVGEFYIE